MSKIVHSNDKFFKAALSHPEVAEGLLKQHLPEKILKLIDLKTLQPSKASFVEPELSEVLTDVLFKINFDQIK